MGFSKSLMPKIPYKSLVFDSWFDRIFGICDLENPILTFPPHSILSLHFKNGPTQMKTEKWFLSAIWRLYFHNAKFDNFKDEKMSDKKNCLSSTIKNLLDWKPTSLINYELLLRAVSYVFLKYCSFPQYGQRQSE